MIWPAATYFRHKKHICISLLTMKTTDKWERNIEALRKFVAENGHARVPATAKIELNGVYIAIGSWVSYLRVKYKSGTLNPNKKAQLETFPMWTWGPCKPGPVGDEARDNAMLQSREQGRSLQAIADEYGLSRQRVHQILGRIASKTKQLV